MKKSRKEIWLYERIDAYGQSGRHLYVLLSNEHPVGLAGAELAEFVEDVYTSSSYKWRKMGQQEAFNNINEGRYTYVNYSRRALRQEWERPVFAHRGCQMPDKPNFLWDCFKKQIPLMRRRKQA